MSTLLFEIGCEELPAAFCRWAEREVRERWAPTFGGGSARALVGPRRIALVVDDFELDERGGEKRGPAETVAFKDEKTTKAAEGFARGLGLSVDELEVRDGYVWGRGRSPDLGDRLWQVVAGLGAGKTMTWIPGLSKSEQIRFPRPIRWLCAKHGSATIEVGPAAISSGDRSTGHRFTSGALTIADAGDYERALADAGVIADADERRRLIVRGLDALGEWRDPGGVMDEVVYLVENPVVLEGSFDERFLELPDRVVETAMQSHQRYLPLGGTRFAFVANGGDPEVVRAGNERVLEGRLDDATFSWERDLSHGIEAMAAELGRITFHAKAGSYADKTARLESLCDELGGGDASRAAARLAQG